jgi:MoaA/NifB/PqqE/SkfB family radical SAM enzyme
MNPLCLLPFTDLEISEEGKIFCCCWGKYSSLGDLRQQSIAEAWNSKEFRILREKIYEGNIKETCDLNLCHILLAGKKWSKEELEKKLPPSLLSDIKNKKTKLSTGPLKITLSDSGICNLHCKMCYRYFVPEDENFSSQLIKKKLPEFLELDPKRNLTIKLAGNGEVFFQKNKREFLQNFSPEKYPHVYFEILTNGLLLTPKMWRTISHNKIKEINVSVDAASKSTYEKIRKGGNWERLLENLRFIGNLRREHKIDYFYINMVVMRSNYQEMKEFVLLAKSLGCDEANFQKVTGMFNLEENINDFSDPKISKEIAEILKDPIFKGEKNFLVNILQLKDYLYYQPKYFQELITKIKLFAWKNKFNFEKFSGKFL